LAALQLGKRRLKLLVYGDVNVAIQLYEVGQQKQSALYSLHQVGLIVGQFRHCGVVE
jgi:hypothetical protein